MEPGAQGKWLILQKRFQLGSQLFLVPLEKCTYSPVDLHEQTFFFSRVDHLRTGWGCRWLTKFSSFVLENVAVKSSPPQENKSLASNEYAALGMTAPSHVLAHSFCFRACACVPSWHPRLVLYHVTPPDFCTGNQPQRRVITPTACPHVCDAESLSGVPFANPKPSH